MSKPDILLTLRCNRGTFDVLDLEEAVILAELTETATAGFTKRQLQAPDWLLNQGKALERFVKMKAQEELEMKLKRLEARRTQLMTPTEQRSAVDAEIEALRAALGSS